MNGYSRCMFAAAGEREEGQRREAEKTRARLRRAVVLLRKAVEHMQDDATKRSIERFLARAG